MSDNADYLRDLELKVDEYLEILEDLFGPRDPRFVFGSIKKSEDCPRLHFPHNFHLRGGCVVDILIGEWPYENQSPDQGPWQLAHECVHLLDPMKYGEANVLEEGLATWFQDAREFHNDAVRKYIEQSEKMHASNYLRARNLVRRCMTRDQLAPVIRELRSSGIRICEITEGHLRSYSNGYLSDVDATSLSQLCEKFRY